nr:hypothetical protein GCM10020093_013540 [Planobispora longispora]
MSAVATATRREDRAIQPYVGLRPYEQSEHPLFFGRAQESRDIATVWQATGLTVLYGASGVGKTSLLNAGILPRIDSERADVLPVARVAPGGITVLSPRVPGNPYILALLSAWSPEEPLSSVVGLTVSEFLYRRPKRADQYGDPVPILAAIDQAEELFSGPVQRETEREDLLKQLAQAVEDHDGLHLLLSLREEHVAAVLPYERPLGHGSRTRFHLRPLKRAAALDAATKPLEYTARSFAPGAAELLIDDLRTVEIVDDEDASPKSSWTWSNPYSSRSSAPRCGSPCRRSSPRSPRSTSTCMWTSTGSSPVSARTSSPVSQQSRVFR